MALIPKTKINALAKDLDIKSKVIIDFLQEIGITGKSHMTTLEDDELNFVFEHLSRESVVDDLIPYMFTKKEALPEKPVQPVKAQEEAAPVKAAEIPEQPETPVQADNIPADTSTPAEQPAPTAENKPVQPSAPVPKAPEPPKAAAPDRAQSKPAPQPQRQGQQTRRPPLASNGLRPNTNQYDPKKAAQRQEQIAAQRAQQMAQNNTAAMSPQPSPFRNTSTQAAGQPQRPAVNTYTSSMPRQTVDKTSRFEKPRWDERARNQKQKPQINSNQQGGASRITISGGAGRANETGVLSEKARIIDTRTSTVDLRKYDEKVDQLVPESMKDVGSEKQKMQKGRQRQQTEKERQLFEKQRREAIEKAKRKSLEIVLPDEIIVSDLAAKLRVTTAQVVKQLMLNGIMATVNQPIEYDIAAIVAEEMGAKVTKEVIVTIEDKLFDDAVVDSEEMLVGRSPVVVVMGHVDHGKTSLLDAIRDANVVKGEAGGITQHIGAYRVGVGDDEITFLDTPGHAAFTAMRARGAQVTDIAILVVAADDGIMPQTIEAINHAKAAGVSIIIAINKMDLPAADPDRVKQNLTQYDLIPEEWGGDIICVPVSAVTKQGIDELLEMVVLTAEMKQLKANPNRRAKGIVIEARLDKGRGSVATVLVQNGTLRTGDIVIAGETVGRVRAMTNDMGQTVTEAGPSVPVEIIGLAEVPNAGDVFNVVEDERMARDLVDQRKFNAKEEEFNANAKVSLDDLFSQISAGIKELNVIVKADVQGSVEAVKASLEKISNEEVKVKVLHGGVGGINETDVMFAAASNAIIVGFNVRPDKNAIDSGERQKVDIRTYRIIYECIEEITAAMKGLLAPVYKEVILGHAQVRQTIKVPNVGTIAGCYVQDGKVTRAAMIRIIRDGIVIFEDKIDSLRRFKDDVREVAQNYECGIGLTKFNDIREMDMLEAYEMEEIAR